MFNSLALLLLFAAAQPIPYSHKTHLALGLHARTATPTRTPAQVKNVVPLENPAFKALTMPDILRSFRCIWPLRPTANWLSSFST